MLAWQDEARLYAPSWCSRAVVQHGTVLAYKSARAKGVPLHRKRPARCLPKTVVLRTKSTQYWHGACVYEEEGRDEARRIPATDILGHTLTWHGEARVTHHSGALEKKDNSGTRLAYLTEGHGRPSERRDWGTNGRRCGKIGGRPGANGAVDRSAGEARAVYRGVAPRPPSRRCPPPLFEGGAQVQGVQGYTAVCNSEIFGAGYTGCLLCRGVQGVHVWAADRGYAPRAGVSRSARSVPA